MMTDLPLETVRLKKPPVSSSEKKPTQEAIMSIAALFVSMPHVNRNMHATRGLISSFRLLRTNPVVPTIYVPLWCPGVCSLSAMLVS